jgi:2-keto-3-deoxy-L-rhamnonate aldolase RhmA
MLARKIKEKMRRGEPSIGSWLSMAHPSIAEILAMAV